MTAYAYARIEDGLIVEYPLMFHVIKERFPDTSFPSTFPAPDGYVKVSIEDEPTCDGDTHQVVATEPALVDGSWVQGWQVVALPDAEVARIAAEKAAIAATQRIVDIKHALLAIDLKSVRPLREGDAVRIAAYEAEAQVLRDELAGLTP